MQHTGQYGTCCRRCLKADVYFYCCQLWLKQLGQNIGRMRSFSLLPSVASGSKSFGAAVTPHVYRNQHGHISQQSVSVMVLRHIEQAL